MNNKPYTDHAFAGIKPFTESLEEAGIPFSILDDSMQPVFENTCGILNPEDDTVKLGKCVKEGNEMFFTEFGIRITPGFRSFIVFLFNHMPTHDELLVTVNDIESIISERLDNIDMNAILEQGRQVQ